MCGMQKAFFTLPLRIGAIIAGWTSLIIGTVLLGYAIMRMVGYNGQEKNNTNTSAIIAAVVLAILVCLANIIVCIALLVGVHKCTRQLLLPFLVFGLLKLFILLLFIIFCILWVDVWNAALGLLALALTVYFLLIVWNLYRCIAAETSESSPESTEQSHSARHSRASQYSQEYFSLQYPPQQYSPQYSSQEQPSPQHPPQQYPPPSPPQQYLQQCCSPKPFLLQLRRSPQPFPHQQYHQEHSYY